MVSGCGCPGSGSAPWRPLWGGTSRRSRRGSSNREGSAGSGCACSAGRVDCAASPRSARRRSDRGSRRSARTRSGGSSCTSPAVPVEPAQQVCERSVFGSAGQRPDLVDDRRERLLRRVGVDSFLPASVSPGSALDAPAEEVEPLIDVADPALLDRQRRPIGASTAPTSSQSASASARVPPTMTTKSSA
jgi:hypothetical protein